MMNMTVINTAYRLTQAGQGCSNVADKVSLDSRVV
jgi:hypothetical protein